MHDAYPRLFEPAVIAGRPNPRHLEQAALPRAGRGRGRAVARRNGADGTPPCPSPTRTRSRRCGSASRVRESRGLTRGRATTARARPTAEAGSRRPRAPARVRRRRRVRRPARPPPGQADAPGRRAGVRPDGGGGARRRRRPDRRQRAFAPTPSRRCSSRGTPTRSGSRRRASRCTATAPSSTSGRRPPTAGWPRNARRFHFIQRYSWEPWHYGYTLNPRSTPVARGGGRRRRAAAAARARTSSRPASRPRSTRAASAGTSRRRCWRRSSTRRSNFNPFAVSPAGAQGIAQFMPGTAAAYGLDDPFDAAQAIDAQAHLMRDLLRRFGSVPLALAAYNAGPARVAGLRLRPALPGDPRLRRADPRPDGRRRRARRRRRPGGEAGRIDQGTPAAKRSSGGWHARALGPASFAGAVRTSAPGTAGNAKSTAGSRPETGPVRHERRSRRRPPASKLRVRIRLARP